MKKKNKYEWKIGEELPSLNEHSKAKHLIISDYVRRYIEVCMSNTNIVSLPISIIDGFSGGGKYNDQLSGDIVDGSPFLMLKAVREAEISLNIGRINQRKINAEYFFVDKNQNHSDFLQHEISVSEFKGMLNEKIFIYNKGFVDVSVDIINKIKCRNRAQRAIFVLDQYAYKDFPFALARRILSELSGSEIILTFNFQSLMMYMADTPAFRTAMDRIDLSSHIAWNRIEQLKEAGMFKAAVQEQLANAIKSVSGAKHITLFFVEPKAGISYWLVHLSKKYRARDVMMDLHWKHSNISSDFSHHLSDGIFSLGYKATQVPGQGTLELEQTFDFSAASREKCVNSLTTDLSRLLCASKKGIEYGVLLDEIGSLTPAAEVHIKEALQNAIDRKEVTVFSIEGKGKRSSSQLRVDDIVRYCQSQLIFV